MNLYDLLVYKKMNSSGGGDIDVESLSVTENGSYNAGEGKAYNPVIVNVPEPTLKNKSITANGTYQASSDNADGYSQVSVNVSGYKITEVSGLPSPIATFTDGSDLPMPKLEVAIEPQQEGSGEPSPTNIRPISGWDEVNVGRTGKNLCKSTVHGYVSSSDDLIVIDNDTESAIFYAHEGQTYTISSSATMNKSRVALVGTDNVVNYTPILQREVLSDNVNTWTATWTGWTVWYKCNSKQTAFDNSAQVELGSTATSYEPYNGQTITIPFQDSQGNPIEVYGGECDVVNGTSGNSANKYMLSNYSNIEFHDNQAGSNAYEVYIDTTNKIAGVNNLISNIMPVKTTFSDVAEYSIRGFNNDGSIAFKFPKNVVSTLVQAKQWCIDNGLQILYDATPTTFYTQPTAIKSLLGTNNLWANTGDVLEASYWEEL